RLLRQISLDGNILRHSSFSSSKSPSDQAADKLGQNFARHFSDTICVSIGLLEDLRNGAASGEIKKETPAERKKDKSSSGDSATNILKALEELNSLIVYLIRLS